MSEYVYATNGTPVSDTNGEISLPRERIIRCRDCKWFESVGEECWYFSHCEDRNGHESEEVPAYVEPDGFCAWGEVRVGSSKVRVGEDA